MRKITIVLLLLLVSTNTFSQIFDPVKWATSVEKISETEYKLISIATIDSGWHLYSQNVPENGPIATSFTYTNESDAFKIVGNTNEEEGHTVNDPIFNMRIKYFENTVIFEQLIEVLGDETIVDGIVEFMVCDDTQ